MMMYAPIENPSVLVQPSTDLCNFIFSLEKCDDMPEGILNIFTRKSSFKSRNCTDHTYLLNKTDRDFINTFTLNKDLDNIDVGDHECDVESEQELINIQDLQWLYSKLHTDQRPSSSKLYFHEMFEGSKIVLPKNIAIERNQSLEKRCEILRNQEDNRIYKAMTKNVDNVRKRHPEDSISYQLKQINRHLIAIAQFIFSVLTGFAFGFIGIELIIGNLDFGFRLLLGIMFALIIALAELYFLAKKLNEDLQFEAQAEEKAKTSKID